MDNHVREWLGAYHDGELRGQRLQQVEQHLVACAGCLAELEELVSLSALLQEPAAPGSHLSSERFAANVVLSLPRQPAGQPAPPQPRSARAIAWWLIPLGLLGAWLFIDITLWLSSLVSLVVDVPWIGERLAWLQGDPQQMAWFSTAMSLFGSQLGAPVQVLLSELNGAHVFITQLVRMLLPELVLAAAYLGWLFSLWLRNQAQHTGNVGKSS